MKIDINNFVDKPTKKRRYACYQFLYDFADKENHEAINFLARSKEVADELARLHSEAVGRKLVIDEAWKPIIRYFEIPVFELEEMQKDTIEAIKRGENIYEDKKTKTRR
jgi:hypothetical protein